jgi:hypothetical protein
LSFTSISAASVDGSFLAPSETYWNNILFAVMRVAAKRGAATNQITQKLLANYIGGQKEEGGYKHIPEVGISVQGMDANGAWKATSFLANAFGIKVHVTFRWQNNPKAANPGGHAAVSAGEGVFE